MLTMLVSAAAEPYLATDAGSQNDGPSSGTVAIAGSEWTVCARLWM